LAENKTSLIKTDFSTHKQKIISIQNIQEVIQGAQTIIFKTIFNSARIKSIKTRCFSIVKKSIKGTSTLDLSSTSSTITNTWTNGMKEWLCYYKEPSPITIAIEQVLKYKDMILNLASSQYNHEPLVFVNLGSPIQELSLSSFEREEVMKTAHSGELQSNTQPGIHATTQTDTNAFKYSRSELKLLEKDGFEGFNSREFELQAKELSRCCKNKEDCLII